MALYAATASQFIEDVQRNQIGEKLSAAFRRQLGRAPARGELQSWQNSLMAATGMMHLAGLTDHGVMLEMSLPMSSLRVDCLICGVDRDGRDHAVILELKQWDRCAPATGDNLITTWVGGANREILHPSAQADRYRQYLLDQHSVFNDDAAPVAMSACAYLHNYRSKNPEPLEEPKFDFVRHQSPTFTADDALKLRDYLCVRLSGGDGARVLARIAGSRYRASKKLMDHVADLIHNRPAYTLLDDQQVVYDQVLTTARDGFHDHRKSVVVVRGGPGTGKSVIALNLMGELLGRHYNTHYATGSRAFTQTLRRIIGTRGGVQFRYFNSYAAAARDELDVLICDEAHRIRETSNNRFTKTSSRSRVPQVEELLNVAKVAVFFVDDVQVVRPNEIGSADYIIEHSKRLGCEVKDYTLSAQFRCNGSDGFLNWVDHALHIRETANAIWDTRDAFDFRIVDSPLELDRLIREKASEGRSARMVAGFCWPWSRYPNPDGTLALDVVVGDYKRAWNAQDDATGLAPGIPKAPLWAYEPGGMEQVGCVYTAQGFEFDYVGVIFGPDLVYDPTTEQWAGVPSESHDRVVRAAGDQFVHLVKSTYRVLLTRSLKGCYVHFMHPDTEAYFRTLVK